MEYYDEDSIQEIVDNVNLLEYANNSYDFKKKSGSYFTNCPKHVDVTPSLSITPEKNLFHCFSCGCGGNIINWMMEYENLSFYDALKKAASLANVDISKLRQPSAMKLFNQLRQKAEEKKDTERKPIDESYLDNFSSEAPSEWLGEGIEENIMQKYGIRIDHKGNRIIYPVYNKEFNLIGVKGRTRFANYKQLGVQKYMNYQKIGTTDFFVGMKENIENILSKKEIIIFEGIKSGMKVESWGFDNWVASETSYLNDEQVNILLAMRIKDIVIAYDNDVSIEKISECTKMLRKFMNVYFIQDKHKLLGGREFKMSPVDCGETVWRKLYEERVKKN